MASQQRLQANLCCQLMTGFSASGDFDGDLDMISFDPMLIDLVKATEIGIAAMCMEEHFQAVDTRRGQWLLLIFTRVFEMCWTKGVKRLFLEGKNHAEGCGRWSKNWSRRRKQRLKQRARRLHPKKTWSAPQQRPKKQRRCTSGTWPGSPPQPSGAGLVHLLRGWPRQFYKT